MKLALELSDFVRKMMGNQPSGNYFFYSAPKFDRDYPLNDSRFNDSNVSDSGDRWEVRSISHAMKSIRSSHPICL